MPPFYDDFEEICSYIDIIKLPGRNSNYSYLDNVEIVRNFEKIGLDSLLPNTEKYLETLQNGSDKDKILLKNWREKIKNCRFQCWNCDLCTKVYTQGKGV